MSRISRELAARLPQQSHVCIYDVDTSCGCCGHRIPAMTEFLVWYRLSIDGESWTNLCIHCVAEKLHQDTLREVEVTIRDEA